MKVDIDAVCLSYRHDFGLLTMATQDFIRTEAKEWLRAIESNLPKPEPAEDDMGPKIGNAIDPKREELLRLAGEFGKEVFKASLANAQSIEMIAKLDSEGLANVFSVMARDSTSLAAAIIAEVDRVSGGKP